jgi:hypothetical protein
MTNVLIPHYKLNIEMILMYSKVSKIFDTDNQ